MIDKLVRGLRNTFYAALTVGTLGLSSLSCVDNGVEPIKPNQKPIASFVTNPKQGTVPLNVGFDGRASYDNDGTISKYIWSFGNGNQDSTSGSQVNYVYDNAGNYSAGLTVVDNQGARSDKTLENIVVGVVPNQKPVAQFTATPPIGQVPLNVNFNGSNSYDADGTISKYVWDFGDGNTDSTSGAIVNYNYQTAGNKNAGLIVTDNEGARSTKTLVNIIVNAVPPNQIAFWSDRDRGSGEIYTAILGGDSSIISVKRLTNNFVNDDSPSFSPDGTKIVFASNREDATGDRYLDTVLWIMNADGSNPQRLTPFGLMYASWPFWAQNGKIYFNYADMDSSFNITSQGVAVINSDGTGFQKLISEFGHNWLSGRPAISSDNSQIAFVTDRDGNSEIYIASLDGSNQRNLTNNLSEDFQPVFSSDGNGIFFTRGNESHYQGLVSSVSQQITFGMGALDPCPSPDGKRLLFTGQKDGWYHLYLQSLEDGKVIRLTFDSVQPDGSPVAYRYPIWRPKL